MFLKYKCGGGVGRARADMKAASARATRGSSITCVYVRKLECAPSTRDGMCVMSARRSEFGAARAHGSRNTRVAAGAHLDERRVVENKNKVTNFNASLRTATLDEILRERQFSSFL